MTIENFQAHHVPFSFESDHEVQDFVVPSQEELQNQVEIMATEAWDYEDDVTRYIDYAVDQIRNAQALADAADAKAKFAQKTAKGFRANVEYRRTLIEAALNAAVSRGLMKQPKVKSAEYSLGIQGTAGRIEVDPALDKWNQKLQTDVEFIAALLVNQVRSGADILIPEICVEALQKSQKVYAELAGEACPKDFNSINVNLTLTWDKKYLGQAIKNNWLSEKLARLFTVVKGKALVIRL